MKKQVILLALIALSGRLVAQTHKADTTQKSSAQADSLLNAMSPDDNKNDIVTFKATRLILSQSTTTVKKNTLNFQIIHRFGDAAGKAGGGQYFYGLDDVADVYIGLEYGLTDNLNIALGRSTDGRLVNLDLKYALLHETKDNSMPVSLTLLGETGVNTYGNYATFNDRMSYLGQVIISRQVTSTLALQVSPTVVDDITANPLVEGNDNQFFALAGAAHLKVTKHMSVIFEYAHPFSPYRTAANGFHDPVGFGIEIETGGHVFTLNITNSASVDDINYLSNTQSSFSKGQYRIGFTISRIFDFNSKSSYK